MLRNIFLKTLRDNRLGIFGWGLGLGLLLLIGASQYAQLLGPSGPARAAQAAQMAQLLQSFSLLIGEIVPVTTLGGFVTVRIMGFVPVMLSLWAIVVGVSLIRSEEERGALDVLLTTPHSRLAVFGQKVAALGVGLLVIGVLQGLGLALGAVMSNEPLPADGLVLAMLNADTIAAFWGAVGLLVAQLVGSGRTAMTAVGGVMAASYLLDNVLTNLPDLKALAWLLPFHYYAVSKPLVPGRTLEVGSWLALVLAAGVLLALAAALFLRRDLGAVFPFLPARPAVGAGRGSTALLQSVWGKALRDVIAPTVGWGVSLALYAALIVGTTNQALAPLRQALGNLPWLANYIGDMTSNESYLGLAMFTYLPVLLAIFALTQIAGWTGDEEAGRLEVLVAAPVPRSRLLLARYGAGALGLLGILALTELGVLATSTLTNTPLDAGRVLVALGAAGLVGLVVLAGGLTLATWLPQPGGAVTITAVIVVVMFFLDAFAQILNWPEVIANLSIFHLYGRPLTVGLAGGGVTALAVLVLILAPASVLGFGRRDIAK